MSRICDRYGGAGRGPSDPGRSSVWVDHVRRGDTVLTDLLVDGDVLTHPFVIGELALGQFRRRGIVLAALLDLPRSTTAGDSEVLGFIDREMLFGQGIGYVDAHLLAAARLTPGTMLWTRDKRLDAIAARLDLAALTSGA